MDKKKSIILVAVVAIVLILAGTYLCVSQAKDNSIVGMYNVYEYHQYSMKDGEFIDNHSGDGAYDSEFIEITYCSNGIFEGYCCVPMAGEVNPPHYPIMGTYDEATGMVQYVSSYSYPQSGLYDWVHGYIKDGTM